MGGYMDLDFWFGFLLTFGGGFMTGMGVRSWLQAEKERASLERARRRHPATMPRHVRMLDE